VTTFTIQQLCPACYQFRANSNFPSGNLPAKRFIHNSPYTVPTIRQFQLKFLILQLQQFDVQSVIVNYCNNTSNMFDTHETILFCGTSSFSTIFLSVERSALSISRSYLNQTTKFYSKIQKIIYAPVLQLLYYIFYCQTVFQICRENFVTGQFPYDPFEMVSNPARGDQFGFNSGHHFKCHFNLR
jgi:hypothetical protein